VYPSLGQEARTRLISELCALIHDRSCPEIREAGLTLIGFLARRLPEEPPHALGVPKRKR